MSGWFKIAAAPKGLQVRQGVGDRIVVPYKAVSPETLNPNPKLRFYVIKPGSRIEKYNILFCFPGVIHAFYSYIVWLESPRQVLSRYVTEGFTTVCL